MKKQIKCLLCVVMSFGLGMAISTDVLSTSNNAEKARIAYKSYLVTDVGHTVYKYYSMIDINGDSVPELVLSEKDGMGDGRSEIFAYTNGNVWSIEGSYGPMELYNKNNKGLVYAGYFHGGGDATVYDVFNGKKITDRAVISYDQMIKPIAYTINGKETTKKKFNAYIKKLKKGYKKVKIKFTKI